jgi:glycosyltransferase involved in cell wall biosynthesis
VPDVSVIITTYNQPAWLELVLHSFFAQDYAGTFELIVADDGSRPETFKLLEGMAGVSPVPIKYIWQPDDGFQKCRILNKAIAVSSGRSLLFTDGDCIAQPNMLRVHASSLRPGMFVTGGYLKLSPVLSGKILERGLQSSLSVRPSWLLRNGFRPVYKLLKVSLPLPLSSFANFATPTKRTWNGHNSSCLRGDALAVNGFNECIQYGADDVEFGYRLNHYGVYGRHIRFSTTPLHLSHERGYVTRRMVKASRAQLQETRSRKLVTSPLGLDQWIGPSGCLTLPSEDQYVCF